MNGGIGMKLMYTQLAMIGVIWLGMFFFRSEMNETSRYIFLLVTSWLLFLIVMTVKNLLRARKEKSGQEDA